MRYGLFLITKSDLSPAEATGVGTEVRAILAHAEAKIEKEEMSAPQKLSYPIDHANTGTYELIMFSAEKKNIPQIQKSLEFVSGVMRSMITSEEVSLAPVAPPRALTPHTPAAPRPAAAARAPAAPTPKLSPEEIDKRIEEMLKDEVVK